MVLYGNGAKTNKATDANPKPNDPPITRDWEKPIKLDQLSSGLLNKIAFYLLGDQTSLESMAVINKAIQERRRRNRDRDRGLAPNGAPYRQPSALEMSVEVTPGYATDDEKTKTSNTTKGGPLATVANNQPLEPGAVCAEGSNCKTLEILLTRCFDINQVDDTGNTAHKFDELQEEIDHCLECHGDHRSVCIIGGECEYKEKLIQCNNNRFVQLHAHFYHNQAIDNDEDEPGAVTVPKEKKQPNIEKIQYKLAMDAHDDAKDNDNNEGNWSVRIWHTIYDQRQKRGKI